MIFMDGLIMSERELIVDGVLKQVLSISGNSYTVPTGVHCIDGDAFVRVRSNIAFKKLVVSEGVTTIRKGAFAGLAKLEIISLPSTLKLIEDGVFSRNTQLTIIKCKAKHIEFTGNPFAGTTDTLYPTNDPRNILRLGDTLFSYYGNDRLVALPKGITRIWTGAFKNNKAVTQIVLPASVTEIMPGAFDNCPNLREVIVDDIDSVNISDDAFINCKRVDGLVTTTSLGELAVYEDISPRLNILVNNKINFRNSVPFPTVLRRTMATASDAVENAVKDTDVEAAIRISNSNGYIEQTARALLIAGRYCPVEDTRKLLKAGFSFNYRQGYTARLDYFQMNRHGVNVSDTPYYLGAISQLVSNHDVEGILSSAFHYSNNSIGIINRPLKLENRMALVKTYLESPLKYGVSKDLMLWFAISRGEFTIAKYLINQGIDLNSEVPYFCPNLEDDRTFIEILTGKEFSGYYKRLVDDLAMISSQDDLFQAVRILVDLAKRTGKKIVFNQAVLNKFKFTELSLDFIKYLVAETTLVGISKKKTMEALLDESTSEKFKYLVDSGWICSPEVRDELIDKAREKNFIELTAWLFDYKHRTADEAREEEKATERFMRELTASPNEPFIVRKNWCYRKKPDGTIKITNYKGSETEVTVPSHVGDAIVTEIGAKCFSPTAGKSGNVESRSAIRSITIPDSVTCIGNRAFTSCISLTHVKLPKGLIHLGEVAFGYCRNLSFIELPDSLTKLSMGTFYHCPSLMNIKLPANLKTIENYAFAFCGFEDFTVPQTVENIGYCFLENNSRLERLYVQTKCCFVLRGQCMGCTALKDIYIGDQTDFSVGIIFFGISNDYTIHTNHLSRAASELAAISSKDGVKVEFDYYP